MKSIIKCIISELKFLKLNRSEIKCWIYFISQSIKKLDINRDYISFRKNLIEIPLNSINFIMKDIGYEIIEYSYTRYCLFIDKKSTYYIIRRIKNN